MNLYDAYAHVSHRAFRLFVCHRGGGGGGGTLLFHVAQDGSTALISVAAYGRVDCARLLLDAGADTNAMNNVRVSVRRVCGWARVCRV